MVKLYQHFSVTVDSAYTIQEVKTCIEAFAKEKEESLVIAVIAMIFFYVGGAKPVFILLLPCCLFLFYSLVMATGNDKTSIRRRDWPAS